MYPCAWFTKKTRSLINLSIHLYLVALLSLATPVFISGSQKFREVCMLDTCSRVWIRTRLSQ